MKSLHRAFWIVTWLVAKYLLKSFSTNLYKSHCCFAKWFVRFGICIYLQSASQKHIATFHQEACRSRILGAHPTCEKFFKLEGGHPIDQIQISCFGDARLYIFASHEASGFHTTFVLWKFCSYSILLQNMPTTPACCGKFCRSSNGSRRIHESIYSIWSNRSHEVQVLCQASGLLEFNTYNPHCTVPKTLYNTVLCMSSLPRICLTGFNWKYCSPNPKIPSLIAMCRLNTIYQGILYTVNCHNFGNLWDILIIFGHPDCLPSISC